MPPLQTLRTAQRLTQKTVGDAILKDRSAIAHWERGQSLPAIECLPDLARLYQVSLEELLETIKANIAYHQQACTVPRDGDHHERQQRKKAAV